MAEENDNNELNPSDMTAPAGGELEQTDDFGLMSGQRVQHMDVQQEMRES